MHIVVLIRSDLRVQNAYLSLPINQKSGKTTLVNYILKEQSTWKIAVIENEFGEVSIDDGLVADSMQDPEDIITMDNGCVCCSLRADLVRTLGMLAKRRADFDAILLETTGVADPAPIIYTMQ